MTKWLLLILIFALPASAQDPSHAETNPAAEQEITKLETDLAQMIVKGNWDGYASHLMDDYTASDRHGAVLERATVLEQLREGQEKVLDLTPEELKIRIYGDTAVVTGHYSLVQRRNGRVDTFFSRETHVFLKRGGHWFLAASQATSVPE